MRLERQGATVDDTHAPVELVEIVAPRTNAATYTPAEHVFAALVHQPGVSLELAGDASGRRFYARAGPPGARERLLSQLGAAYPQARFRSVELAGDPARRRPEEQVLACRLGLRQAEYLPLRIPHDTEVAADRAAQADPLLGVLSALGGLPDGWRALSQLVLQPATDGWARPYLRRSIEHALAPEQTRVEQRSDVGGLVLPLLLLAALVVGPPLLRLYTAGNWLLLGLLALAVLACLASLALAWRWLSERPLYDQELVREKITWPAARAELRLAVFAPAAAAPADLARQLDHLVAAYRAYDLERGNALVPRQLQLKGPDRSAALRLCVPRPLLPAGRLSTLTSRELAGLWHLVQAGDDVALVERTTARRFLPLPETVASGLRVGIAEHQGRLVPVHLAPELLRRHELLVGKSRKGKSALLGSRWRQLAALPENGDTPRPTVVLVDPHSDLAEAALGLVPAARHDDVVCLDVGRARQRPFGLNLLDVGLGWDRDRLVENALLLFRHEFDQFWGPRMELVFRFALLLLLDANEQLCRDDPTGGRDRQYTILEVPRVLEDEAFRSALLPNVRDPQQRAWWSSFFDPLDRRFRLEIINPVQTKTYKFAANAAARAIVGQSRSTIDPAAWVRDGALVVVDLARSTVGADIAALLGGALVNLIAQAIGDQAALPRGSRRHVALLVDEFHALPAADYAAILAELAKYGASLTLATQTLGALAGFDRDGELRAKVFGNTDHLFAFNCSAEDARLLAPELGASLEPADLVELGDYQCYARLSHGGERLPAFHLRLDPPPPSDDVLRALLTAQSDRRYGRDVTQVAADRATLLERMASLAQPKPAEPAHADTGGQRQTDPGNGRLVPALAGQLTGPTAPPKRNEGRSRKAGKAVSATAQLGLQLNAPAAAANATDVAASALADEQEAAPA
jgi:hypothetical protein